MKVLLVEDEDPKREKIRKYVISEWPKIDLHEAKSVRSAIASVKNIQPELILLDMSLPTFDITDTEPGGRPQGFGGREVLKYLSRLGVECSAIVVTGYEAFVTDTDANMTLEEMHDELTEKFPSTYMGIVYYNSLYEDWKNNLKELMKKSGDFK